MNTTGHSHQCNALSERLPAMIKKAGMAEVIVKNKFAVGDSLELILPDGNHTFVLGSMQDAEGTSMAEAPGSAYQVKIPVPVSQVSNGLLAKNLPANKA